jgi:hypothetical protein
MLHRFAMDDHTLLRLTSLTLLYCFVNVLYIWTQFLLLNTFCHDWSRLVALCNELHYIISFDLHTVFNTFFWCNLTQSHSFSRSIRLDSIFTVEHFLTRIVTLCNELIYIVCFELYSVYMTRFDATEHKLTVSHFRYFWTIFLLLKTFWHEWSRIITLCNELLYKVGFDLYAVYMTRFDAT